MAGFRPYQALIRVDRIPCPELGAGMRRREFIGFVGGVAALPLAARSQQSSKMKRIAMVHPAEKVGSMTIDGGPGFRAFFEELNRLSYVEGQNLIVERYSAAGRIDYFSQLARDVVNTSPDVIFAQSNLLVLAFKAATASIPIVVTAGA